MAWWAVDFSNGDSFPRKNRESRRYRRKTRSDSRDRRDSGLYYGGKGKKPRMWYIRNNNIRFLAAVFFAFFLLYEIMVLKRAPIESIIRDAAISQQKTGASLENSKSGLSRKPDIKHHINSEGHTEAIANPRDHSNTYMHKTTHGIHRQRTSAVHSRAQHQASRGLGYESLQTSPRHFPSRTSQETHHGFHLHTSSEGAIIKDDTIARSRNFRSEISSQILREPVRAVHAWRKHRKRRIRAQYDTVNSEAHGETERTERWARREAHVHNMGLSSQGSEENFWNWFQQSKRNERGGASSIACPEMYKRLCRMFYKILKKYKIRKVFDASCVKNLEWMPIILKKISNEMWGFKYYCNDPDEENTEHAKEVLQEFNFVKYHNRWWWKTGFPDELDLVFAWDTLAHTAYGRVWSFFVHIRKQRIKYVLFDNYPGIPNNPGPKRYYVNVRKYPFKFPAAKDVIQNVTEPGETARRQLLCYESNMLPEKLGTY